jgi:16S rRNA (cytidine1402-2'-O)-methyltransferase
MSQSDANDSEILNSKSPAQQQSCGDLYVVSTPIGNLEDITLRALRVLKTVDMIAAENVPHTRILCGRYGIKTRLSSYHQHNQKIKAPGLIKRLKAGADIAIVTDAGTPGISDPGVYLINRAIKEKINVTPIPGASAVIAAISVSGFSARGFVFLGFLSNKSGKRKRELKRLSSEPSTMVFFEAPHRLTAMLIDLREILGDRQVVILREMTKVFEEVKRGTVSAMLAHLTKEKIIGEFTLVVEGTGEQQKPQGLSEGVQKRIEELLTEKKMSIKDIAILLSSEEEIAYRRVYKECLAIRKVVGD